MRGIAKFLDDLATDDKLKLGLITTSFLIVGFPASLLLTIGVSEKIVFPSLVIAMIPVQYALYRAFQARVWIFGSPEREATHRRRVRATLLAQRAIAIRLQDFSQQLQETEERAKLVSLVLGARAPWVHEQIAAMQQAERAMHATFQPEGQERVFGPLPMGTRWAEMGARFFRPSALAGQEAPRLPQGEGHFTVPLTELKASESQFRPGR